MLRDKPVLAFTAGSLRIVCATFGGVKRSVFAQLRAAQKAGAIVIALSDSAVLIFAYTGLGEDDAMALAQNPKVLLLDEPFAGLSIDERGDVKQLLLAIPRDVTIVMIEHDMDVALDFAERITVMHFGEIVVEGSRAEVVADPRVMEIYLGA